MTGDQHSYRWSIRRSVPRVPRRIAIELDGVLARVAAEADNISQSENFCEMLGETEPNVVARLAGMAADRRWELIFLTKRSPSVGSTVQAQSQRWLEAKGFTLPCVYVAPGRRGRIASALQLDLVVDVRPDNCVDVVSESDARAILVWPGDPNTVPADARRPEIAVARSFGECLDMLAAVDDLNPPGDGLFAWMWRLLGLKRGEGLKAHSTRTIKPLP